MDTISNRLLGALLLSMVAPILSAGLMPLPLKYVAAPGKLIIDSNFRIVTTSVGDARMEAAFVRATGRISRQTGIPIYNRGGKPTLVVSCKESGPEYPALGEDESYTLDIASDGAKLNASTVTGALRGLETFIQLISPESNTFYLPGAHIEDRPRFPWRGLMLDVSRHWMSVPVIERNLDAMAAVKLNVFHWHLSDDQGFRVESKRFPKLHQLGSDGKFYTQAQVRDVVNYARDRGIRVIPEFDIPGHTTSWFAGYPELASAPGPYTIERKWGVFQPTLDPAREETYTFIDEFLAEMTGLFPDRFFHIGGDEVDDAQWKTSNSIQTFERENHLAGSVALHAYFNRRLQDMMKKHGKTMVGWDEILAPGLAKDTVIQSWRGQASLADAGSKGYRGILSFGYYLDHLKPASFHYAVDPDPQQTAQILGGEACMWTEYVSEETVDSRIWPRAAAIAERLWSAASVNDADSMYQRLEAVSRQLQWVGIQHRSNYQPMLDRLRGDAPPEPLRVLADASEALGIEGRRDIHKYTSQVLLNRFVDAVRPESEGVRQMEIAVRKLIADPSRDSAEIQVRLTEWSKNDDLLRPSGYLGPISRNLAALGSVGLQALEYLRSGHAPPEGWVAGQIQSMDRMQDPQVEVRLAAVRPVRQLLQALADRRNTSND